MEQFVIEGGHPLSGTVVPAGNKNATQPLLAATLLTEEPVVLKNVPQIGDIAVIVEILRDLGADVRNTGDHELAVCTKGVNKSALRADLCRKVRGSFMFAGPLLGRFGQATIPRPGGDRIGRRRVDTHLIRTRRTRRALPHQPHLRFSGAQRSRWRGHFFWTSAVSPARKTP